MAGGSDWVITFVGAPPVFPDIPQARTNTTDYVIISAWQQ